MGRKMAGGMEERREGSPRKAVGMRLKEGMGWLAISMKKGRAAALTGAG
jgi:hypothetical protein